MVHQRSPRVRLVGAAAAKAAKQTASPRLNVHPLSEAGWEDELAQDSGEWVEAPGLVSFKVVGSRGICPMGFTYGDVIKVGANGAVSPGLRAEAAAVLRMAARDDSEIREWCCPVYDHLLVFKKPDQVS